MKKDIFEIEILPGTKNGHIITLFQEGDELPGTLPGDILLKIETQKHKVYTRKGHNLYMIQNVPLHYALSQYSFEIEHLDKRIIRIMKSSNEILSPDCVRCIPNEGMPHGNGSCERGDLIVLFKIDFPKRLTHKQQEQIKKTFESLQIQPSLMKSNSSKPACEYVLQKYNGSFNSKDETEIPTDFEEEMHHPGVQQQCAQQ